VTQTAAQEYCANCKRRMSDDWLSRLPGYGVDYGESHEFCEECLDMLELGQGLLEDALFRAEWDAMIAEQRADDPGFTPTAERDKRRALRMYASIGRAA
jgi:hypothetical protein